MTATTTPAVTAVPFSKLVAGGDINARATGGKDGLDALAASIKAKGLIQPLIVRPAEGGDRYEVIAGNRRLAAIGRLVKDKVHPRSWPVPVVVRNEDDGEALDTSLAENDCRLPMHAVDRFEAFDRLSQSLSVPEIAARYAVSERQVKQSLALGRLAPQVREAWRKGRLDAKTAQAFTLNPSHETQAEALAKLQKTWGRSTIPEHSVRSELAGTRVAAHKLNDEVMARYVAAGGKVSEDLFSEESYCDDAALVERVTREWAEAEVADLKARFLAAGWSWVAREKELQDRGIQTYRLDTLDDEEGESEERGFRVDLDEMDETEAKFSAEEKARSGVVVYLYTNGAMEFQFGVLEPKDQTDLEDAIDDSTADEATRDLDEEDGEDLPGEPEEAGPFAVSGALTERVTTALTLSAATALDAVPMSALRVLLAGLTVASYATPAKVSVTRFQGRGGVGAEAERDFDEELAKAFASPDDNVIARLAHIVADSLNLVRHQHYADRQRAGAAHGNDVAALLAALPGDIFTREARGHFNAADYFKSATKATAIAAIAEIREAGHGAGLAPEDVLAGMKKPDLASAAADAAIACGWLPPELRHPAYSLAAPEAPARKSKKKAAA